VLEIATTRDELRAILGAEAAGYVPTMGALHQGHISLIERAVRENARTVVSLFVNPKQFGDPADLVRYPRDRERDFAAISASGATVIFSPRELEIYPPGFETTIEVTSLSRRWEGAARPGHFRGVATVVTLLLSLVRPARAYFGEKDFQQLRVIQRLHADLGLPGSIVPCPTVRDSDGLALSSRNARLSALARRQAVAIPRALFTMRDLADSGEREIAPLIAAGSQEVAKRDLLTLDYLTVVDPSTLEPIPTVVPGARALIAVSVEGLRLIDNLALLEPLPAHLSG